MRKDEMRKDRMRKDEMRKYGTRNEGMRNEGHDTPGCIEDPISDPRVVSTLHISCHYRPNRCFPRAHFNDRGVRDPARETRRIGMCSSAELSPCLHHLPLTKRQDNWPPKKTLLNNLKRAIMDAKHALFQEVSKPIKSVCGSCVDLARPSTTFTSPLPVIFPELQAPVQIPPVSSMQMPATPRSETVQIPVTLELMTTVFQLLLQIPDQPVQLFLPDPPQPPVQILLPDPPQPPVQILLPDVTSTTCADSFNRSTCSITTCDRDFGADPYERL
ncbi:hypothetical protein TNCV_339991 [Trichonephila clavipes]|nr:hypothetical protein TNCV_339991 [Trichonephila clavipes]